MRHFYTFPDPYACFIFFLFPFLLCNRHWFTPSPTLRQHMGFIRFYYLSSVAILATSALSLPATLTEDVFLPSRPFSTTGARSLSLASAKHTTHHHVPSYHQFPTQSSLHRPTSVPSIGLTSPHDTPPYSSPTEPDGGHQNPTVIIFATIGGTIGLIFLALFMRQAIAYFRLPRHNAALTAAAREQLEREMAENATRGDQRWSYPAPPPPYERAPSYQSC